MKYLIFILVFYGILLIIDLSRGKKLGEISRTVPAQKKSPSPVITKKSVKSEAKSKSPRKYAKSSKRSRSRGVEDADVSDGGGPLTPDTPPGALTPEKFKSMQGSCDPNVCLRAGYCKTFAKCGASAYEQIKCPVDMSDSKKTKSLWWNLEKHTMHGGLCDLWDNLSPNLQNIYIDDFTCIPPCGFKPKGECSSEYTFSDGAPEPNEVTLSCNPPLIFNMDLQTCDFCSNVMKNPSSPCCAGGSSPVSPPTGTDKVPPPTEKPPDTETEPPPDTGTEPPPDAGTEPPPPDGETTENPDDNEVDETGKKKKGHAAGRGFKGISTTPPPGEQPANQPGTQPAGGAPPANTGGKTTAKPKKHWHKLKDGSLVPCTDEDELPPPDED